MTFTMLVYMDYDQECPERTSFDGTIEEAIEFARDELAFEVDAYYGGTINPDAKSAFALMYSGDIFFD